MELERARDITGACLAHTYYRMGFIEEEPPSLEDYSLRELLDANHRVDEENKKFSVDGKKRIQVICADRLVAALYTLYHYQAELPDSGVEPIAEIEGKVLCCIQVKKGQDMETKPRHERELRGGK